MRVSVRCLIVAALALLCGTAPVKAEFSQSLSNQFGRWLGYGWSEGYHAYDECPPPCRPPMHLKWQPLVRPKLWTPPHVLSASPDASEPVTPQREELLPPPVPLREAPPAPDANQETSILKQRVQERRALKPSQQARPVVIPIPRGFTAEQPQPARELLPASAIEIVAPPATPRRYPLTR